MVLIGGEIEIEMGSEIEIETVNVSETETETEIEIEIEIDEIVTAIEAVTTMMENSKGGGECEKKTRRKTVVHIGVSLFCSCRGCYFIFSRGCGHNFYLS
jgi:hypothetical protein